MKSILTGVPLTSYPVNQEILLREKGPAFIVLQQVINAYGKPCVCWLRLNLSVSIMNTRFFQILY